MTAKQDEVEVVRELVKWIAKSVMTHRSTTIDPTDDYIESLLPPVIATIKRIYALEEI